MPVAATSTTLPAPLRRPASCPDLTRLAAAAKPAAPSPIKDTWSERDATAAATALQETPRVLARMPRATPATRPAAAAEAGNAKVRSNLGASVKAVHTLAAALGVGLKKYGPPVMVGVLAGCLMALTPADFWLLIALAAVALLRKVKISSRPLGTLGPRDGLGSDVGRRDPSLVDVPPEIETWMRMIRQPERVTAIYPDAPPSANLLLYGPTGVGKTASLRLLSQKHGYSFHVMQASDFASKYVGESEKNVAEAFRVARLRAARTEKPVILLFDEIDTTLGKARGTGGDSLAQYRSSVLGEFLQQLDGGVASNHNVFVAAATNRPQELDPALESRFNTSIKFTTPSIRARGHFFRDRFDRFKNTFTFQEKVQIVLATDGMSYRDLDRAVLYNAAHGAASAGRQAVAFPDIMAAVDAWQSRRRHNEKSRQMPPWAESIKGRPAARA